jgi:hypothetical protein
LGHFTVSPAIQGGSELTPCTKNCSPHAPHFAETSARVGSIGGSFTSAILSCAGPRFGKGILAPRDPTTYFPSDEKQESDPRNGRNTGLGDFFSRGFVCHYKQKHCDEQYGYQSKAGAKKNLSPPTRFLSAFAPIPPVVHRAQDSKNERD